MVQAENIVGLKGKALKEIKLLGMVLKDLSAHKNLSIYELMDSLVTRIDYINYLDDGSIASEDRIENVKELLGVAKSYQNMDLETFLTDVALVSDLDSHNSNDNSISLMTLHSAKGLEFNVVFMVGMEEGVFPHSRSFFEPEELEEERRLCYVGMTRAKQQLYMIHASTRLLYGNTQHNLPSRFIADIPEENLESDPNQSHISNKADNFFADDFSQETPDIPLLNEGDRVRHPLFGDGIVVSITEPEATIRFNRVGQKTLNLQYAPISKI
jgi:DNA helicase-2/ATP-dependent DNA helicase PcrA